MADSIKIVDPYENYDAYAQDNIENYGDDLLERVQSLQVGFGSKVLRIDRDGLWLGSDLFADAPFSVDMQGNMTATSLDLSAYLQVGEALADVQGDIFDLADIDTDLGVIFAGTLIGVEVRGSLIRTSTSGDRVEIDDATNNIEIYDSGGTKRIELDQDEIQFFNSSGAERGGLWAGTTEVILSAVNGGNLQLQAEGSLYGVIVFAGGSQIGAFTTSGLGMNRDINMNANDIRNVEYMDGNGGEIRFGDNLDPAGSTEDLGGSLDPWDRCHADDFYGVYNAPSDRRLKTDIKDIATAIDDVLALRPVQFKYKPKQYKPIRADKDDIERILDKTARMHERNEKRKKQIHYGFIAQEVEKIYPALVTETDGGKVYKSLKYDEIVPLLVKALQEQQEQIDALVAKVNP